MPWVTRRALGAHRLLLAGVLLAPAGWAIARGHGHAAADGWALFCGVALYPLLEEWCFRGGLQPWLVQLRFARGRMGGVSTANLLASLAFALAHAAGRRAAWAAATLLPSLLLGAVRERYGRVAPAVALHAWFNAGVVLTAVPH